MILHNNPPIDTIYTDMSISKWYKAHEEDPVRYRWWNICADLWLSAFLTIV